MKEKQINKILIKQIDILFKILVIVLYSGMYLIFFLGSITSISLAIKFLPNLIPMIRVYLKIINIPLYTAYFIFILLVCIEAIYLIYNIINLIKKRKEKRREKFLDDLTNKKIKK